MTTHPKWDTAARIGATLVEQHSPGLLAGKKMSLLIGDGPISAVTEAPRLGFLSLTPSWPRIRRGPGCRVRRLYRTRHSVNNNNNNNNIVTATLATLGRGKRIVNGVVDV